MPEPQPQEWAQAYARIQRLADRDALAELRRAVRDINSMLRQIDPTLGRVGDLVRIQQLQTVKRNLLIRQSEIFTRMGDIIAARREAAAAAATNLGSAIDQVLFDSIGQGEIARQLRNSLDAGLAQTVDVAVTRITVSQVPLAQRIYNSSVRANGIIQKRINSALLRGLSAQEFAREARDWFNPDTPGGVRYAAFRLARTEINNAFHATSVIQAQEKPWIDSMKWHLSRSHPKADDCDRLAKGGPKGDGVYPKGEVPKKPHPQCFCYVTPVSPDEDEFLDGLVAGKYDQYLRQKMGQAQVKPKVEASRPNTRTPAQVRPQPTKPAAPTPTVTPLVMQVPAGAQRYHRNLDGIEDLARMAESEPLQRVALAGGVTADTELLTYANGRKLVHKSAGDPGAEHAASILGRALGVETPRVYRNQASSVYMDYLDNAKTAVEIDVRSSKSSPEAYRAWRERRSEVINSDDGKILGLFDIMIRNRDRSIGNWMLRDGSNRPLAIDHGHSGPLMAGARPMPSPLAGGPFAETIFTSGWKGHPFTAADLAEVRRRVEAVGEDLVKAGQHNSLSYALAVLDKMSATAKATRNLIAKG